VIFISKVFFLPIFQGINPINMRYEILDQHGTGVLDVLLLDDIWNDIGFVPTAGIWFVFFL